MIVHDSWWSNGSARSTIIDYHEPFDQGFSYGVCRLRARVQLKTLSSLLKVIPLFCIAHPDCA